MSVILRYSVLIIFPYILYYLYFLLRDRGSAEKYKHLFNLFYSLRPQPYFRGHARRKHTLFPVKKSKQTPADQLFQHTRPEVQEAHKKNQHERRMIKRAEYAKQKGLK
jgi:hypothetical protein